MRIPFTVYRFVWPQHVSEDQFIALKLYPAEMRRERALAMRGAWTPFLLRALACIALIYFGIERASSSPGTFESFLIYMLFAGALSLFLTTGSYGLFRFDQALYWYRVGALAKRHGDYLPFLKEGRGLGLLSEPRTMEERGFITPDRALVVRSATTTAHGAAALDPRSDALAAHMRSHSVARLNAMKEDLSLSADARERAAAELRRRS